MANKKRTSPITPAMIVAAREKAGLSQTNAAKLASLSLRIWQAYEGGEIAMTTAVFREFERLANSSCIAQ